MPRESIAPYRAPVRSAIGQSVSTWRNPALWASHKGVTGVGNAQQIADLIAENTALKAALADMQQRIADLELLADTDSLAPIANRRMFLRMLEQACARVTRHGAQMALIFADLDGLKAINDAYGHAVGDAALLRIADALQAMVRANDCVARVGGDEFAVLLDGANEADANAKAAQLAAEIAATPLEIGGHSLHLGLSWGVAVLVPGEGMAQCLARADAAMYRSREIA